MGNPSTFTGRHPVFTRVLLWLLLLGLLPAMGQAQDAPQPPCGNPPWPPWPTQVGQLSLAFWSEESLTPQWQPPACSGWQPAPFSVLMAAAGRVSVPGGRLAILARLGQVSQLAGLRYWSVTRGRWTELISQAHALSKLDPDSRRADFSAAELRPGNDYLYWQQEPTTSGSAVYALRLLQSTPQRLVIGIHNATPSRYLGITMLDAGKAQTLYVFQHLAGDQWGYYQLTRLGHGRHDWLPVTRASYANRAQAVFRWFAGLPEDVLTPWKE
jgi:hypothetical protein